MSQTIDLTLTQPLQVTATIQAPTHTENITVALRPADDPGAQMYFAQPGEVQTIPIPYAGRYWLTTRAPTHCPALARVGRLGVDAEKLDAKDHAIQLSAGVQYTLDVTFTSDCGTIEGKVVDAASKVVLKSRQLILLSGTPEDPGDLLTNSARARTAPSISRESLQENMSCGLGLKPTNGTAWFPTYTTSQAKGQRSRW
jgi:hypothetical protein